MKDLLSFMSASPLGDLTTSLLPDSSIFLFDVLSRLSLCSCGTRAMAASSIPDTPGGVFSTAFPATVDGPTSVMLLSLERIEIVSYVSGTVSVAEATSS